MSNQTNGNTNNVSESPEFIPPEVVGTKATSVLPNPDVLHEASLRYLATNVAGSAFFQQCCKELFDRGGSLSDFGTTMCGVFTKEYIEVIAPASTMQEEIVAVAAKLVDEHYTCVVDSGKILISWDPKVYLNFKEDTPGHP